MSKTKIACISIVVIGVMLHVVFGYFAFHPGTTLASTMTRIFVAYVIAVPITLIFLRGGRAWRWTVFGIWSAYLGLFVYTSLTID
jgi:hypothetical protein